MARIIVPSNTPVGVAMLLLASLLIQNKARVDRLMAVVDQITNAGANKALLESSTEALIPAGQGITIYNGVQSIQTQLAALAATLSAIDQAYTS